MPARPFSAVSWDRARFRARWRSVVVATPRTTFGQPFGDQLASLCSGVARHHAAPEPLASTVSGRTSLREGATHKERGGTRCDAVGTSPRNRMVPAPPADLVFLLWREGRMLAVRAAGDFDGGPMGVIGQKPRSIDPQYSWGCLTVGGFGRKAHAISPRRRAGRKFVLRIAAAGGSGDVDPVMPMVWGHIEKGSDTWLVATMASLRRISHLVNALCGGPGRSKVEDQAHLHSQDVALSRCWRAPRFCAGQAKVGKGAPPGADRARGSCHQRAARAARRHGRGGALRKPEAS